MNAQAHPELWRQYVAAGELLRHFEYLADALASPNEATAVDVAPLLRLTQLDEALALALCPFLFQRLRIAAAGPAAISQLLRAQPPAVVRQVRSSPFHGPRWLV